MKTHRTVLKTSIFPAGREEIWSRLQKIETLQYIAAPFATFSPVEDAAAMIWREGEIFRFRFKLFGLLPLGIQKIHVIQFSEEAYQVYTEESNPQVPVWNHKINLRVIDDRATEYTDEVEIYAGWKTALVSTWAKAFYRHRQKKWIKLLARP